MSGTTLVDLSVRANRLSAVEVMRAVACIAFILIFVPIERWVSLYEGGVIKVA